VIDLKGIHPEVSPIWLHDAFAIKIDNEVFDEHFLCCCLDGHCPGKSRRSVCHICF
jgi:hypothetical protein